jgi:hypothetical protein
MKMQKKIFCVLMFFLLISCADKKITVPYVSFFYWNVTFEPTDADRNFLSGLNSPKIYLRYFDVIWDDVKKDAMPTDKVVIKEDKSGMEIVPVVFITLKTLENMNHEKIPILASNIAKDIMAKSSRYDIKIKEIILDHDWNRVTREKYFALLRQMKKYFEDDKFVMKVSSTIRLHQFRYFRQTGVPPVDKGYLMIYNTYSPKDFTVKNTILDIDSIKHYLDIKSYPLELAPCLPLFSWVIQYDENDKFIRLFQDLDAKEITNGSDFSRSKNIFTAKRDMVIRGKKVLMGDRLKFDGAKTDDLSEIIKYLFLKGLLDEELIFYNYDRVSLKKRGIFDAKEFKEAFGIQL